MSASSRSPDRFATTVDHEGLVANAGLILAGTLMARLGVSGADRAVGVHRFREPGPQDLQGGCARDARVGGTAARAIESGARGRSGRVLAIRAGKAPSVVGSFLRMFTWASHVRQLERCAVRAR